VLPCVAACCSALKCVAVRCSALQCVAVCCSVLQCITFVILAGKSAMCDVFQVSCV